MTPAPAGVRGFISWSFAQGAYVTISFFAAFHACHVRSQCGCGAITGTVHRDLAGRRRLTGRGLQDLWSVELNAEQLRNPVQSITLNLPGQPEAQIQLQHWEARRGYITYEDDEGVVHTIPDPKAGPDDFSWLWYGKGEGWTVSLTMHKGVIAGRVSSAERRYGLEPRPERATQLGWINSDYWTTHPDEQPGMPPPGMSKKQWQVNSVEAGIKAESLSLISTASWDTTCSAQLNTANRSDVDVLVLYTPEYLGNAGSVVQVEAAVQAALDDANTSLRNSAISSLRYALAGVEAVPVTPNFDYDDESIVEGLYTLSGNDTTASPCDFSSPNTAVRARRDANYADVTALARKTTIAGDNSCGAAWIQHKVDSGGSRCEMEPGNGWGDTFPYLVFNTQCNGDRLNFAHELGHILGMEHDPINSSAGPSSGVTPSCPWSYGHRRADAGLAQSNRFRTVMAYWYNDTNATGVFGPPACANNADCQQIDAYSNWNLQWTGANGIQLLLPPVAGAVPIGVQTPPSSPPGQPQAYAFDTLQRLGPVVAGFKHRPDGIFAHDFD